MTHGVDDRRSVCDRFAAVCRIAMPVLLFRAAAAMAAEPEQPPLPLPGLPEVPGADYLVQLLLSLLLVVGLILAVAWLARRLSRAQANRAGHMRLVGGLSLGTRERVMLIEAGGTHILLGVAPGRVQTLHVFAEPLETAATEATNEVSPFAGRLQAILQRRPSS